MPSGRRPDSWILLPGPNGQRNQAGASVPGSEESLSEFASESRPQVIPPRIQHSPADRHTANRLPAPARSSERRALRLVASLATRVREPLRGATGAIRAPRWTEHVRDLRRFATNATLAAFASGATAGVLVMWLGGAQRPSPVEAAATKAVTVAPTPPSPHPPASTPDVQTTAESMAASSAWLPPPVSPAPSRTVGTSGRGAAPAVSEKRRAPAVVQRAQRASYQGSLALLSAPQGARVFVNGAFVGSTPLILENLPVGSRAVRIEADGYQRWSGSTQVVANQQTRISATLGRVGQ